MGSIHGLQIGLRIPSVSRRRGAHSPVRVKENNDVRSDQVDAQTSSPSGEQEDELFAPRRVVLVNGVDPILVSGVAVDTTVLLA